MMRMDSWTIAAGKSASDELAAMLNRSFAGLSGNDGEGPWAVEEGGNIRCCLKIGQGRDEFCSRTGQVLAEYTVEERELKMLRRFLETGQGLRNGFEIDLIVAETIALLDGEPEPDVRENGRGRERRIRRLGQHYAAYLKENDYLNLDGFIRFRLREYREEVKEAAETALEERLMERQYQEFVSLLQTMVEWQEVKMAEVHVLHGGGHAFKLLDDRLRPLERDAEGNGAEGSALAESGDGDEEESMLVSRLLAASPRRLYIHTDDPEAQVIRTLMGIFGERAALCPEHLT